MKLKRRQDVEWLDLPKVETPYFARSWVESNMSVNDPERQWVHGLDDVIWDDLSHSQHIWDDHARTRLLERVESAEVLLIHGFGSDPVMPVVRRGGDDHNENWKVDASLGLEVQLNVHRMLEQAYQTRGIWAPIIQSKKSPPKAKPKEEEEPEEKTVTNPRWEHIDEKRKQNSPDTTIVGDDIKLLVDVSGFSDGARVSFKVFDTSISPPSRVGVARGEVEGGVGTAEWKVKSPRLGEELEFEGEVRRVISVRADIPVVEEFDLIFSF